MPMSWNGTPWGGRRRSAAIYCRQRINRPRRVCLTSPGVGQCYARRLSEKIEPIRTDRPEVAEVVPEGRPSTWSIRSVASGILGSLRPNWIKTARAASRGQMTVRPRRYCGWVTTSQNAIKPPVAKRVDSIRTVHGDEYNDVYAWLAHKDDPDTIALLEAENAYTEQETAHLAQLREDLFNEVKARTQETDLSLPVRKGGFWYYTRTVEGQQYGIHCRVVAGESTEPPATESGKPLDGEEILLDGNELAAGHDFFTLGTFDISPDGNWLAYSTDFSGDERYTIRIKDLRTGEVLADEIGNVGAGSVWSLDASVLFYTRVDDAWRPFQVWRHVLGAPVGDDQIVYHEEDEQFFMEIDLSRSERFIFISCGSSITTEVRFIPADAPLTAPVVIAPR